MIEDVEGSWVEKERVLYFFNEGLFFVEVKESFKEIDERGK